MFLFASHNVLTEKKSPVGYLILHMLQIYLDLDMWESLEVHTTDTITLDCQAVLQFSAVLMVCISSYDQDYPDSILFRNIMNNSSSMGRNSRTGIF